MAPPGAGSSVRDERDEETPEARFAPPPEAAAPGAPAEETQDTTRRGSGSEPEPTIRRARAVLPLSPSPRMLKP